MSESSKSDVEQVIGAGVVGLAVARKLTEREGTSTLLIERHGSVGAETSSRNSEVSIRGRSKMQAYSLSSSGSYMLVSTMA